MRILIQAGAGINVQDESGMTPIMDAISVGSEDASRILIEAGAKLEYRDEEQRTALWYAIIGELENCVRLLIEAGVDLETWIDKMTPLALAIHSNQFDIVEQLLKAGADVHSKDGNGRLALSKVETPWIDPRIHHLLSNYGADILMLDDEDYVGPGICFVRGDDDVDGEEDLYCYLIEEDIFAGRVFGGTVSEVGRNREYGEDNEQNDQSKGRGDVFGAPLEDGNDNGSDEMNELEMGQGDEGEEGAHETRRTEQENIVSDDMNDEREDESEGDIAKSSSRKRLKLSET
jgi:hypothetical protein